MYEKVYSKEFMNLTFPIIRKINIDQSNCIDKNFFDFKEVAIALLSNDDIMNPNHLQIYDNNNPYAVHPRNSDIGEIITSDVF